MTPAEVIEAARLMLHGPIDDVIALMGPDRVSPEDWAQIIAVVEYEICRTRARRSGRNGPQKRAMGLLTSLLDADQRQQLRTGRAFRAEGSLGGLYRLYPTTRAIFRIERHGKRYFARASYCIHHPSTESVPPADTTISQLLLLATDEEAFLTTANARSGDLWNGTWLRQVRAATRERRAAGLAHAEAAIDGLNELVSALIA